MKAPTGYSSRPGGDDPRSTEAWALGEASRRLALAARMDDKGEALREALRLNQRLWSIFQAALTEPDCPLPQDVRDNVLAGLKVPNKLDTTESGFYSLSDAAKQHLRRNDGEPTHPYADA